MSEFFPRHFIAWRLEQPPAIRRLTLSLPQMALVTGIVMRLWRSYVLTHGSPESWAWVGGTFLAGAGFLFLMCAIHLGNFTLRNWLWRAPAFAVLESGTEIVMSLALTTVNLAEIPPPNRTELTPAKPDPVMATVEPGVPPEGRTLDTVTHEADEQPVEYTARMRKLAPVSVLNAAVLSDV